MSKWLVTPIYGKAVWKGTNPTERGRNRSPWLLTTYKSWDDPPSPLGVPKREDIANVSVRWDRDSALSDLASERFVLEFLGRSPIGSHC